MSKPLDLTKPVQTRDGRPVRIVCTDRKDSVKPIIGLVTNCNGEEAVHIYTQDGYWWLDKRDSGVNLTNVPEKRFVNLYRRRDGSVYVGTVYPSEEKAKKNTPNEFYIMTVELPDEDT